jgi:hypothetical protein
MVTQEQAGGPTPQLFFQTANAYQRSQALKAAIELDLFTAIGGEHNTVEALAQRCGAAARGVRILADYLTIQGFLTKEGARYKLTPDSAVFLDRRSPGYMGAVLGFLHAPKFTEAFENLTEAVRKGGTVAGEAGTVAPEHPLWVEFAKSMIPMMAKPAEEIGIFVRQTQPGIKKVLDIAAGHGLFGIEVGMRCPEAEIVALDWPNVLAVAQDWRIRPASNRVIEQSRATRFSRASVSGTTWCCSPTFSITFPPAPASRCSGKSIKPCLRTAG